MDENWTRKILTALLVVLLGGGGAAYMLMHLDHAARRQLSGLKYWYPNKIVENDLDELKKIRRRIKGFYITCLVISIICAMVFIFRLTRNFG